MPRGGNRGVCCFVRAAKYSSLERSAYFRKANQALVIVQVEGPKGMKLDWLSGRLTWAPADGQEGTHPVEIEAEAVLRPVELSEDELGE